MKTAPLSREHQEAIEANVFNTVHERCVLMFDMVDTNGHAHLQGHHAAQRVAEFARDQLRRTWNNEDGTIGVKKKE